MIDHVLYFAAGLAIWPTSIALEAVLIWVQRRANFFIRIRPRDKVCPLGIGGCGFGVWWDRRCRRVLVGWRSRSQLIRHRRHFLAHRQEVHRGE